MDPVTGLAIAEDIAWLPLDDASAVGSARRAAERLADQLGLPTGRVAEVGLAVTEIATNVHCHAGGGALLLRALRTAATAALEVVAIDAGPGIADLAAARRTAIRPGAPCIGLGSIERLADAVDISSEPGRGTVLIVRFDADRRSAPGLDDKVHPAAGITRALSGEAVCGDAYAVRSAGSRLSLMICDGSGHGPLAAAASREAVRAFSDPGDSAPGDGAAAHPPDRWRVPAAAAVAGSTSLLGRCAFAG